MVRSASTSVAVVALAGRPNVGKSTLFNRVVGQRRAIVEDEPGTTRDRSYGSVAWAGRGFLIVDTAGLSARGLDAVAIAAEEQAMIAVEQADVIVMLADVTSGVTLADQAVARVLLRSQKPVILAVNKCDSDRRLPDIHEFMALGMGDPMPISAFHGSGVPELLDRIAETLPLTEEDAGGEEDAVPRIAIIGRPNAGKSSLFNRLLGEERALVSEIPGTTRDSIDTLLEWDGRPLMLVDTAGLRRRGHVDAGVERHSVIRALGSVRRADLCLLIVDATQGIADQDAHIAGYVLEQLRGIIVVAAKWDLLPQEPKIAKDFDQSFRHHFRFMAHAPLLKVSSVTGQGVEHVLPTALTVYEGTRRSIATGRLNRFLLEWAARRPPQVRRGNITRLRYATQTAANPPTFQLFFSDARGVHRTYLRYLENGLRREFGLDGAPVKIIARGPTGGGRRSRSAKDGI